jgi:phosphoserine phosphatase RsbU/P
MKILIADDSMVTCEQVLLALEELGLHPVVARDGAEAWAALQGEDPPSLAILDWLMPHLEGPELCRRIRTHPRLNSTYVILLTIRESKADVVAGLASGADDYVTKSDDVLELQARVMVGVRMVELQRALAHRVRELEDALAQVKSLQGLLPICAYCKKIRDDGDYWHQVEHYLTDHTEARFSQCVCPKCQVRVGRTT